MAKQSMTGFGTVSGQFETMDWVWEIRSVNGRGLDIRMRLPDGCEALEAVLRAEIKKQMSRGNVSVNLKYTYLGDASGPALNIENLSAVIKAAKQAQVLAEAEGLDMAPVSAADLVSQKWVWEASLTQNTEWITQAKKQISDLVINLTQSRAAEGDAIVAILRDQVEQTETLNGTARKTAEMRNASAGDVLRDKVRALLEITDLADEERLAQELAVLAIKSDVSEELDRLDAHITAAHTLLAQSGPAGRKLDFLMQEFNREANTLCSKSGSVELTAIGLELKLVIDQMREQVQNLE